MVDSTRGLLAVVLLLVLLASPAAAQIKVGVIVSASGALAGAGRPQLNTVPLLPRRVGDATVEYLAFDDASETARTIALAKRLIAENKVDAIVGPTGSAQALAVLPLLAEAGVPMLTPARAEAIVRPMDEHRRWAFKTTPNESLLAGTLLDHMKQQGVKSVGLLLPAEDAGDPVGDGWLKAFTAQAQAAGIGVGPLERYSRGASSATAQAGRLAAARPDAVLIADSRGPALAPQLALLDQGYKGRIYQTHGVATPDFIRDGGKRVDGTFMVASPLLALKELPDGNPSRPLAQGYVRAYEDLHGTKTNTYGAYVYDAGLLLKRALPIASEKARPGTAEFRAALHAALEQTRDLVATQGVYTMSPEDHSGLDRRGAALLTVREFACRLAP